MSRPKNERPPWRPLHELPGIATRDVHADDDHERTVEPVAHEERRDADTRAFGGHAAGTWPERFDVENVEDVAP